MASLLDVGYVTPRGQDTLPSTGEHLDVRVTKEGKYIDPSTIRSLLTRLKVGKDKKPLWQQQGDKFSPSFPITSGYGPRIAPTKGASTYHQGVDFGVAGNTPLTWEGPGSFTPGQGYGTIKTTDAQGTPYEVKLLHTKGGKQVDAPPTSTSIPANMQLKAQPGDTYIFVGGRKTKQKTPEDFLMSYIKESMLGKSPQVNSMIDPTAMLTQAFSQTPNYLS